MYIYVYNIFLLVNQKVHFLLTAGQTNPFLTPKWKKNRMQHGKKIYFRHMIVALALLGHRTSHSHDKLLFPYLHNKLFNSIIKLIKY